MANLPQHRLEIELEETGERTDKIQSYSIESDYMTPTDAFEVVLYHRDDPASLRRKWLPLRRVKLYLDGKLQLVGRIDETEGTGDSGAALMVRGRDYLAPLIDGSADPSVRFSADMVLGDAILEILKPYGIVTAFGNFNLARNLVTGVDVPSGIPAADFREAKVSEFKVGDNQGAHEAANRIAARHGFTLQPVNQRDSIAIVRPQYGQSPRFTIERPGNVLKGSAKRNYADVPTVTIATARGVKGIPTSRITGVKGEFPTFGIEAPNEVGKFEEVKRITGIGVGTPQLLMSRFNPRGEGISGNAGLLYKPLFYEDKDSKTVEQLLAGMRRMLADRLKETLVYSCTMQGHTDPQTGAIYYYDTIATVRDEIEDVNEDMWILSRWLRNDGTGPLTNLKLIRPGAIAL